MRLVVTEWDCKYLSNAVIGTDLPKKEILKFTNKLSTQIINYILIDEMKYISINIAKKFLFFYRNKKKKNIILRF